MQKTSEESVTVVVPLFNEAEALPCFAQDLLARCAPRGWKIIFVDDGSRDDTPRILSRFEAHPCVRVIHHKVNRGYGGALKTGLMGVTTTHAMTIDGDGQHRVSDAEALYEFAIANNADMVVGSRMKAEQISPYRELGKWLIRKFAGMLVPLPIRDLNSGFKLYQTELVRQYLPLCPDSMAFSEVITLLFLYQKHLVLEYPIEVKKRAAGSSSINTGTAFQTVIEILSLVMLVNPLRIFLPLSILSIAAGLLWGIPIMLAGRGVSVGSMLAIVLGSLFFFLGLIANQLSLIRLHLANLKR